MIAAHRLLTKEEFLAHFSPGMVDVTGVQKPVVDIWPYVDSLSLIEIGLTSIGDVEVVYSDSARRFDHILITGDRANVYLVLFVDREQSTIVGHHVLDLNIAYGLESKN